MEDREVHYQQDGQAWLWSKEEVERLVQPPKAPRKAPGPRGDDTKPRGSRDLRHPTRG